ncbi:MAG TPA: carbon-nitrogen hydrolase family protein [Gemmataceae bacterium]|jgi:predicted amidohydrolase|nr:carbon-nitrogen hydrolase family protein [Gemmataceae bacterium]
MRIGHCQLEATTGDFDSNLGKVVKGLERADKDRVAIVSFPECFLTGYPDKEEVVRKSAFAVDSPQMMKLLDKTGRFEATFIVGFNETRGADLYNTAVVVHKGHILGTYSKCSAYMRFHKQGREFPVFERAGVKFGVIICSDGGYIEPARILALKGARIIFAPHFNYIGAKGLIGHFQKVRADHTARAVENDVWFVRGNNVVLGKEAGLSYDGVGYGDSYVIDPAGEMVVRTQRHQEDFIFTDVDPAPTDKSWSVGRSMWSAREFGKLLLGAAEQKQ